MTTLAQARASLRIRIEDGGGSPLFADADLNEFISRAVESYGRWNPKTARVTVAVVANATSLTPPAGTGVVVRVFDGAGDEVRVSSSGVAVAPGDATNTLQAWRAWAGSIFLQRPVGTSEAGTWTVEHLDARTRPAVDGDTLDVDDGDDGIVIELAAAQVYNRRAFEDSKRGASASALLRQAEFCRDEARRMWRERNRRIRSSYLVQP